MQFFCCDGGRLGGEAAPLLPTHPRTPFIHSLTEPALCKYVLKVCVPALCVAASAEGGAGSAGGAGAAQPPPPPPPPAVRAENFHAPLRAPAEALDAAALPPVFFAAALSQVLNAEELAALEEGAYGVGTSPVVFTK